MYHWHIYNSFYFLFFTSFIYQFFLTLCPWKYCTSWFSSFTIYAVVMAVAVRFLVLTRVVPLVRILTECNTQKFEGIDAIFFFFYISKVLWLHQKEILTQRAHFSRYGTDCPNNRLCCLYEFVQGYYSQD